MTPEKKILHLTLKKKWFDLIALGEKIEEYRERTLYWRKRLVNEDGSFKKFDEIHFRNGYRKNSPFMRVEWIGVNFRILTIMGRKKMFYAIQLGKVLEVQE